MATFSMIDYLHSLKVNEIGYIGEIRQYLNQGVYLHLFNSIKECEYFVHVHNAHFVYGVQDEPTTIYDISLQGTGIYFDWSKTHNPDACNIIRLQRHINLESGMIINKILTNATAKTSDDFYIIEEIDRGDYLTIIQNAYTKMGMQ